MDICPVIVAQLVVKLVRERYTVREDSNPNEKEELIAKEILNSLYAIITDAQFEEDELLEGKKILFIYEIFII